MAEIDIEQKESGGVPWWVWLLGALVLAGLIWVATSAMSAKPGDTAVATTDNSAMVADNTTDNSAMMADANVAPVAGMDTNTATDNAAMMADTNSAMANPPMDTSMSNGADGVSTVPGVSTSPSTSMAAITNILSVVDAKDPTALYGKTVKLLGAPVQAAGKEVFWIGPSFEQKMLVVTDASTNMNGINTGVALRDRVDIEGTIREITDFNDAKTKYKLDDNAITFLTNKKYVLMANSVKRDAN